MRIIRNSLKAVWDRWEDPGDYPSGAGAGLLPKGPWQLTGLDGSLGVQLTQKEMASLLMIGWDQFVSAHTDGIDLPDGVGSVLWETISIGIFVDISGSIFWDITLGCADCEIDPDYTGPEPPDHKEY